MLYSTLAFGSTQALPSNEDYNRGVDVDKALRAVEKGHTLRAALAWLGATVGHWEDEVHAHPELVGRLAAARERATYHLEERLLAIAAAGGSAGTKAQEDLDARQRVDWGAQAAKSVGPIDQVLADPALLAEIPNVLRDALSDLVKSRRDLEAQVAAWIKERREES